MPVDDHRVEGLVNGFIAGKQDALFDAPDGGPAPIRAWSKRGTGRKGEIKGRAS